VKRLRRKRRRLLCDDSRNAQPSHPDGSAKQGSSGHGRSISGPAESAHPPREREQPLCPRGSALAPARRLQRRSSESPKPACLRHESLKQPSSPPEVIKSVRQIPGSETRRRPLRARSQAPPEVRVGGCFHVVEPRMILRLPHVCRSGAVHGWNAASVGLGVWASGRFRQVVSALDYRTPGRGRRLLDTRSDRACGSGSGSRLASSASGGRAWLAENPAKARIPRTWAARESGARGPAKAGPHVALAHFQQVSFELGGAVGGRVLRGDPAPGTLGGGQSVGLWQPSKQRARLGW